MSGVPAASVKLSTGWKRTAPAVEYRLPQPLRVLNNAAISRCCCCLATLSLFLLWNRTFSFRLFRAGHRFYVIAPGHISEKQILKTRANHTAINAWLFCKGFSDDHRDRGRSISHSLGQHDYAADRAPARRALPRFKAGSSLVKEKAGFAWLLPLPQSGRRRFRCATD